MSSARLPFDDLAFGRPESREEKTCREAERLATNAQDDLRKLAKALGITDEYKAPEQVSVAVRQFCHAEPPRVPDASGWWWFDDGVAWVATQNGILAARINGRWKPVTDEQPWRGPAIVDPRVRQQGDDADIPF